MADIEILPIDPQKPADEFAHTLEGVQFRFRVTYTRRDDSWRLSIYDSDRRPIRLGCRVAVGRPVFSGAVDPRMPPGRFAALDARETGLGDPGAGELGARVKVIYFPSNYDGGGDAESGL